MKATTIERVPNDFEKGKMTPGDKRCYVPGYVVRSSCPTCGKEAERDLGQDYISYPPLGVPSMLHMYCGEKEDGGCGGDWPIMVVVEMSVRLAEQVEVRHG